MKLTLPRIPVLSTFALLLLITLLVLWIRSPRHADALLFYTPAGHITGLSSDHGGIVFCATDISAGEEMGLSADAMTGSADEFAPIQDTLFDTTAQKWHFLGFRVAAGTLGTWGWKFGAVLVPYWALLIPLALASSTGLRRAIVRARRRRRGQCVACGYDLRQSPERCPECGRPVSGERGTSQAGEAPAEAASVGHALLSWIFIGGVAALTVVALLRGRRLAASLAEHPPELRLLDRPVNSMDLGRASFPQVVDRLRAAGGEPVEVDAQIVTPDRHLSDGSVQLHDVSAAGVLNVAYHGFCKDAFDGTQLWVDRGAIHIGSSAAAPLECRSYAVADLLDAMPIQFHSGTEPNPANSSPPVLRGGQSPISHTPGPVYPSASERDSAFADAIASQCGFDAPSAPAGITGGARIFAGRLWVWQTQEGHAAVRSLLAMMRSREGGSAAERSADARARENLAQVIPDLNLEGSTLEEGFDELRRATGANLVVYWDAFEAMGVARDLPIDLRLRNVTLGTALEAILARSLGVGQGEYVVKDGVIVVATPNKLSRERLQTRVYDLGGVMRMVEAFNREPFRPEPPVTLLGGGEAWGNPKDPKTSEEAIESICALIEDFVDTDSWKDNGGSVGSIHELAGRLIVTQSPAAHREIAALVRTLAAGGSKDGMRLLDPEYAVNTPTAADGH